MEQRDWQGVFPAITTPFLDDLRDRPRAFVEERRLAGGQRMPGIVALGSLGEAQTLTGSTEKISILETLQTRAGRPHPARSRASRD